MSSRTRSGLLLPILVVVGAVAVFGIGPLKDMVSGVIGGVAGYDTVLIGEGATTVMVVSNAKSDLEACTVDQITSTKQCDDTKVLVIDAVKMPYIARNIHLAWGEGQDSMSAERTRLESKCVGPAPAAACALRGG